MENQSCPNCRSSNIHYNVNNLRDGECQECGYYAEACNFDPINWPIILNKHKPDKAYTFLSAKQYNEIYSESTGIIITQPMRENDKIERLESELIELRKYCGIIKIED